MPNQNMISVHMPPAEYDQVMGFLSSAEALLNPYTRNLSEEENQKVGAIQEGNKLFVNKVKDFHESQPALDSPDVEWGEFEQDYLSRDQYGKLSMLLLSLEKRITETRRLHDYDNYQSGLLDYDYTKYKNGTAPGAGYDSKAQEYGQFFKGGGSSTTDDESL
ncbi:MAG: hypothetical protein ACI97X_001202 [Oceanospirillaceae bacterium]|jgi:hypothetical protein